MLYKVIFSCSKTCNALAASLLCFVSIHSDSLYITEVGKSDRYLLFLDKIFFVYLSLVRNYLCSSFISELFFYLKKLVLYNSHEYFFIRKDLVVPRYSFFDLFVFSLYLFSFETLESRKPHIEYCLSLNI